LNSLHKVYSGVVEFFTIDWLSQNTDVGPITGIPIMQLVSKSFSGGEAVVEWLMGCCARGRAEYAHRLRVLMVIETPGRVGCCRSLYFFAIEIWDGTQRRVLPGVHAFTGLWGVHMNTKGYMKYTIRLLLKMNYSYRYEMGLFECHRRFFSI
jgi:hypothetical protein